MAFQWRLKIPSSFTLLQSSLVFSHFLPRTTRDVIYQIFNQAMQIKMIFGSLFSPRLVLADCFFVMSARVKVAGPNLPLCCRCCGNFSLPKDDNLHFAANAPCIPTYHHSSSSLSRVNARVNIPVPRGKKGHHLLLMSISFIRTMIIDVRSCKELLAY